MKIVIIAATVFPILAGIGALIWFMFLRDWLEGGECLICDGPCRHNVDRDDPDSPCSYGIPPNISA